VAPITDCLKNKGPFLWIEAADEAFILIKDELINALILAFPGFDKVFKLECDSCGVDIGAVLSQEKRPIIFLSEKWNEVGQKWFTYEKQLSEVYRSLKT